jgi:hypothetical protein
MQRNSDLLEIKLKNSKMKKFYWKPESVSSLFYLKEIAFLW